VDNLEQADALVDAKVAEAKDEVKTDGAVAEATASSDVAQVKAVVGVEVKAESEFDKLKAEIHRLVSYIEVKLAEDAHAAGGSISSALAHIKELL
jgi:hypothetical protein